MMDQSIQDGPNIPNWANVEQMDRIDRSGPSCIEMSQSGPNWAEVNEVDQMDRI